MRWLNLIEGATYNQSTGNMEITFDPATITMTDFKAMIAYIRNMKPNIVDYIVNGTVYTHDAAMQEILRLLQPRIDAFQQRQSEKQSAWSQHYPELKRLVDLVPTKWLRRLQGNELRYDVSNANDEGVNLMADIDREGIRSPVKIIVGQKDRYARIGEGNHRIMAALQLGLDAVPATVIVQVNGRGHTRFSHDVSDDLLIPVDGYVPAEMKPSMVFKSLNKINESRLMEGIRAYHGSPHDFSEFDMVQIGTGEGAQTFGHGMYFADAEEVAIGYRDRLSPKPIWTLSPEKLKDEFVDLGFSPAGIKLARETLALYKNNAGEATNMLDALYLQRGNRTAQEAAKLIRAFKAQWEKFGKMYEVDINIPRNRLLNWDAMLSQQSMPVQKSIERLLKSEPGGMDIIWRNPGSGDEIDLSKMGEMERAMTERTLNKMGHGTIAPRWQHRLETASPRQLALGDDPTQSSEMLMRAGIPGIRYLDGFSREHGKGSSNYVIFDLSKVKIIRKY